MTQHDPSPSGQAGGAEAPASTAPITPTREDLIIALADIEECEPEEIIIPGGGETDPDLVELDAFASRLLRARRSIEGKIDHLKALAKLEADQLRARFERQGAALVREAQAVEAGLDELSKQVPYPKGKKSRTVGAGRYGRRTIPQSVEIIDETAFIEWATAKEPGLVKPVTKVQIERTNLKKYVKENGDVPIGTQIVPERDVLSYAFAEDEATATPTAAPGGEA